jgi:subtilisin-like proprotein convertase family protein
MRRWFLLVVAAGLALAAPVPAAVPKEVQLQAMLSNALGGAVVDGEYAIKVAFYADETGGKPLWSEAAAAVNVKGGVAAWSIGSQTPLQPVWSATVVPAWVEVQVLPDPPLPRRPLQTSLLAQRSGVAEGVDCSGCITAAQLDPKLLADFVKASTLAKVATTGQYADLQGGPDLSPYAKTAALAKVAISGQYADLQGAPKLGMSCGTGLVVKGFKVDGSLDCAAVLDPKALPAVGLAAVSNGLLTNQFQDVFASAAAIEVPDNSPVGVSDTIDVPDLGLAQTLQVSISVTNSDISTVTVLLLDPAGATHTLYAKGKQGNALTAKYPTPDAAVAGDLGTWVGKNPKGQWKLTVIDQGFLNNKTDGQLKSWSVVVGTLSSQKVAVTGRLVADGGLQLKNADKDPQPCGPGLYGFMYYNTATSAVVVCTAVGYVPIALAPLGAQTNPGASCKDILAKLPGSKDGAYWIGPLGAPAQVWCDMTTDGGGWTVLAINGDLGNHNCIFSLSKSTSACGSAPDPGVDWQLAGAKQDLLTFTEVVLLAYTTPGSPSAATKLATSAPQTVGSGNWLVTPKQVGALPAIAGSNGSLSGRTTVALLDGYTVWGVPDGACPSGVNSNLGLDVPTTAGGHDYQGWDDNNNGCGLGNQFSPADLGSRRGWLAVR